MIKKILITISIFLIIFFLGKNLNPLSNFMFDFHDETQPARIHQFVLNLKNGQIPPRIAPQFNFNLGFPIFNYYAPASYWITSFFHLIGFSIINSLKISFLLAIVISFYSMYKLISLYFGFYQGLTAGLLYASSPWIASEIFIRGNLGEIWFIALMPLAFYFLKKNSVKFSKKDFFLGIIILGLILTTHNILSLVFLPIVIGFIFILPNKKRNLLSLFFALILNSYYFIPAILEINYAWATTLSKHTNFSDHLLCLWQLWTTNYWGYGGSVPGCQNDGMAFMIGKPQIILGVIGLFFLIKKLKDKKNSKDFVYFILITFLSIFFSTYLSYSIAKLLESYLNFFQFPWRFLAFIIFGICFFIGAVYLNNNFKKLSLIIFISSLIIIFYNQKFFKKTEVNIDQFNKLYLSKDYLLKNVSYKVYEYLPKTVDYNYWLKYQPKRNQDYLKDEFLEKGLPANSLDYQPIKLIKNEPFEKLIQTSSKKIIINISYLPYWQIYINNKTYYPKNIDQFGRPIVELNNNIKKEIKIKYQQTIIQKIANILSLISFLLILKFLWKIKKI